MKYLIFDVVGLLALALSAGFILALAKQKFETAKVVFALLAVTIVSLGYASLLFKIT